MGSAKGRAAAGIMKPALEYIFKHADDAGGKAGREAAEKAAKEAAQKAAKEAAQKTAKETAQKGTREAGQEAAEKTAKREARDAAGKTATKDPIDLATGEVLLTQTDARLPGVLPLVLQRTHLSSHRRGHLFGVSWASTLDQHLDLEATGIAYAAADGMVLRYPMVNIPRVVTLPIEGSQHRHLAMTTDGGYALSDLRTGHTLHFPAPGEHLGWSRLPLTAITDRNGNRIDLVYDEDGVLAQVQHSGGYRIAVDSRPYESPEGSANGRRVTALRLLTRDTEGQPRSVTLMRYGHDANGDLAEVINESGQPLRLCYDDQHRLTGWQDRNGHHYDYTYDRHGRAIAGTGAGGYLNARLDFSAPEASGSVRTVESDSLGHATVYEFNDAHQLITQTDPLGNTTRFERDRYNRLLSRTDPLGNTTRFSHDANGNLTSVIRPDRAATRVAYNELGLPVEVTDPDGTTWRYTYDERGNLTSVTDPAGAATTYQYNDHGHLTAVRDGLGAVSRLECDPAGLPVAIVDPVGGTTRMARDAFGRVTSVTDPVGGVTRIGWTVKGELAWRTMPDGATERWSYDSEGNLVEYVDAAGQATRTEIGAFDLPTATTGPDGARLTFGYDTELRLAGVSNPQGLEWRYVYDATGNLVSETDFNGRTLAYAYDQAGRLASRTNGAGQTITFTRDALGDVVEKRSADGTTTFTRDLAGRLLRAVGPDADLRLERDAAGRVVTEICNGRTLTLAYDRAGRRIHRRTPSGAESSWAFDTAGLPASLSAGGQTIMFDHDAAGRETQRRMGPGAVLTQQWNPAHRLIAQSLWGTPVPGTTSAASHAPQQGGMLTPTAATAQPMLLQHRTYTYRPDGNVVAIGDRLSGDRRYDLDRVGRVTAVTADGWTERYAYDTAGNITSASWPVAQPATPQESDPVGERQYSGTLIRQAGNVRYEHDEQGRVTLRQQARLSSKPLTWRYYWNAEDRLIGVRTPDDRQWRYVYDPLGRRIAKQLLSPDRTSIVESVDFVWEGTTLAEQLHSVWTPAANTWSGRATTWDYRPGSHRPVAQTERVPSRTAAQEWIDEQFHAIVTDLVGAPAEMVDASGKITWRSGTTLWGTRPSHRTLGPGDCPLRFPGQYHDSETGLNYNFHRYYDPQTARFESSDPVGLSAGPNPHSYVHNPLRWLDPLGLTAYDSDKPVKLYRSPGEGNRANERHGLNAANHEGSHPTAYLSNKPEGAADYAGNGHDPGFHEFTMKPGFREAFGDREFPLEAAGKNLPEGTTEYRIPAERFDEFNSFIDHDKTDWWDSYRGYFWKP